MNKQEKPLVWLGSSKKDLVEMPVGVRKFFGHALHFAQCGEQHSAVKILKGFGGGNTLEIVANEQGNTFRTVYTTKYKEAVFVLHVFQKKSKKGISTPKPDMDIIQKRMKIAEKLSQEIYDERAND